MSKGPTRLGGKAPAAQPEQEHQPVRPEPPIKSEIPADVAAAAAAAAGTTLPATQAPAAPPAPSQASPLAEKLASNQASPGNPNFNGAQGGPSITLGALLRTEPIQPEDDKYNPGWRLPRYFYAAVRLLAFRLREDQSKVAEELMYAAFMGQAPSGALARVPQRLITEILQQAYTEAAKALGADNNGY